MSSLNMWTFVIAMFLAISGIGLFIYIGVSGARRSAQMTSRLRGDAPASSVRTGMPGQLAMRIAPQGGLLDRNVQDRGELMRLLVQAGWRNPQAPAIFTVIQLFVTLLGALAGVAAWRVAGKDWSAIIVLIAIFAGLAVGYLASMYVLRSRAAARQRKMRGEVRIFVQLLTMIMDVGLSTRQTLATIARDGGSVMPNLADELKVVLRQVDTGGDEPEALRRMGQELDVADLTTILGILRQVDRFGGGVKEPLLETLAHLEEQNKFRLQELVGKISARMTMVMVLFFLPALLAFTAGPGFLGIIRALGER